MTLLDVASIAVCTRCRHPSPGLAGLPQVPDVLVDIAPLRPLASSLDPLPGEALSGFLLRLAYRLEQSPTRIAQITGLLPSTSPVSVIPFAVLMDMPLGQRAAFAAVTRLTGPEAAALCVSSFAERYPPAAPDPGARTGALTWMGARSGGLSRWIFDRAIRWCPDCLAGDGTRIQDQLGGPWSKAWRLAVVFGCPRHKRLLDHLCSGCTRPVTEPHGRVVAVPAARCPGVHPACCRLPAPGTARSTGHPPACGASLTAVPVTPATALTGPALHLQRRILRLLDPTQPGETTSAGLPATAAQYFTDLQLIASLVRASWPRVRTFADVPGALESLAEHDRERASAGGTWLRRIYEEPPSDAASNAALLAVADSLLRHDSSDLSQQVLHLLAYDPRRAGKAAWTRRLLEERPGCSPGMLRAITPAVQSYGPRPGGRRRRGLRAPFYPAGYGPFHVAQFLQDDWYQQYLAHLVGINPVHLRRTAAIALCQLAAGGSVAKAANLLGMRDPQRAQTSFKLVQRWAAAQPDPRAFENAVHALAEYLGKLDSLIDYNRRRTSMEGWCISSGDWSGIRAQLGPYHRYASGIQLGDRRRETASMIVWTRVTQGEHVFAPHPIIDQQPPDVRAAWLLSDYSAWARIQKNQLRHVEADLYSILYAYADDLAAHIDNGEISTPQHHSC